MADYRDHYEEIRAAGTSLVAVSVDTPEKSDALRRELVLPFPILCDTQKRLIQDWDVYNPREKGGIAKPAVFIIDCNRILHYSAVDRVATRVAASKIVRLLQATAETQPPRRTVHLPLLKHWLRAIRNAIQH